MDVLEGGAEDRAGCGRTLRRKLRPQAAGDGDIRSLRRSAQPQAAPAGCGAACGPRCGRTAARCAAYAAARRSVRYAAADSA